MSRRAGVSPDETRSSLLQAAMALLVERGVGGVRVSEVAKRAGVSTGAIYSQFGSKAELLIAAVSEHTPPVISQRVASGNRGSVPELFEQVALSLPERAGEVGPALLEIIVSASRDDDIATVVNDQFLANEQAAVAAIRMGQQDGEIDPEIDAEALGRFVSMVALGSLVAATVGLPAVDDSGWAQVVSRMISSVRRR